MNTRAAGRGTTTAGIAATTDAVTTVAAAGERGRQGTTRGVIYQPGSTLTKFGTFPKNRDHLRTHAGRSLPRGVGGVNTRAAGRGTTTAGIAATTDAVTTVAAAGERGRQGTTRGVIYQPGSTLTKFGTFPENRTTSVSRSLTGSSTVPFHRGGRCFVRLPVSRSLTGSSTVPVHRKGGSRQRMSGPSTMSHPAMWTCPACGRPLTVALNPEEGEAGAHRPLEISRASAAAHACAPAARFPQFHNASSLSIIGYEPASCQPWQPPVSAGAGAEDDEGVISQSEYTLTKPSSCPNHRDAVTFSARILAECKQILVFLAAVADRMPCNLGRLALDVSRGVSAGAIPDGASGLTTHRRLGRTLPLVSSSGACHSRCDSHGRFHPPSV